MKEIIIKKCGYNNIDLLVEFYDTGVMMDWQELQDMKDVQREMANFLFGDYKIVHN